jgi:RNA recognition motif-containing protein
MKIFVGNLASHTDEEDVRQAFVLYGAVDRVNIARNSADGSSRGFAFVDMSVDLDGQRAISKLSSASIHGHQLTVKQAHRKEH